MDLTAEQAWDQCLEIIRDNISRQSFNTWFKPLKVVSLKIEEGVSKLKIKLPSRFYYEWLEEHYFELLRKALTMVLGPESKLYYDIVIEVEEEEGVRMELPAREPAVGSKQPRPRPAQVLPANPFTIPGLKPAKIESGLNPAYTFESFIEGDGNRLARSAALAVAKQPGTTSFNPMLIYGGIGLGKTHLIQAIGNSVLAEERSQTVLYMSIEKFIQDFINAIQNNRASDFSMFL